MDTSTVQGKAYLKPTALSRPQHPWMACILARKWIQEPEIGNGKLWSLVDVSRISPLFLLDVVSPRH